MSRLILDARSWLGFGALASAAILAAAHGFETFGHYPPCELCYKQRDVHWLALWVGVLGFCVTFWRPSVARSSCALLGLVFVASAALASYHAGVEWKWWPGPAACTGGHFKGVGASDLTALLTGQVHIVQCDEAAWRMLGISMAGYNAALSAALALLSFVFAFGSSRRV